jgi:hypothetical protein
MVETTETLRPLRCRASTSVVKSPSPEKMTKWSTVSDCSIASTASSISMLPLILRRPSESVNSFAGLVTTL